MEKIKQFVESEKGKDIMVILIVILMGVGAFELGRLSKSGSSSGIKIEYNGQTGQANVLSALEDANLLTKPKTDTAGTIKNITDQSSTSKNFFASNRGKKYYPVGCSAGDSLKKENRIYFATREDAEKAGYTLSSSCR